ncbi:Ig-like domain-containing protein [Arthrobacter oryzae]|uniref:S26 family signal peptidase n=1 Tax=Arthrobacter oryzae TaxID=409290 RepID=UPI002867A841|nr:Ig-like domain-containing protein [Arthrobacter oryzae]MDR6508105.1 signal peptidase I [Arthrobacter oryzae]
MNREESGSARVSSRWGPLFSADGWALFLASLASRLYLGVLFSLALFAVLPALLGWHGTVVQSGSMEPHISAGDVVLASGFSAAQKVPVGGVVEFTSPAEAEPGGVEKTRLHRIVAENPDGTFVTAGDANKVVDSTPLERARITGQARLLVPNVGLPGLWLGSGNLPALTLWAVISLISLICAVCGPRPPSAAEGNDDGDGPDDGPEGGPPPPRRGLRAAAALGVTAALTVLVIAGAAAFSSAAYTASTANAANTFSTPVDWAPPTVALASPGTTVKDATVLTATAADAETGIRDVAIQYLPAGGSAWTTICTAAAAPYSCGWNTKTVTDGPYSLRAVAADRAGHTTTSSPVDTIVANSLLVILADPGEIQRGTVNLSTTLYNPGAALYTVRVEYSLAGANNWKTLCSSLLSPYNCTWTTALFANDYYDLRAVATAGTTSTYSAALPDILVDNLAPTVTMTDPGTPLAGTRTFAATAADAHSGIAQTQIQYSRTGTWSTLCTIATTPYSCRYDTTTLPGGTYSFRAVATDEAGISTTSATVANRVIDNTIASVSVEDPGDYLTGTVPLTAAANSTAGVSSVKIQSAPAGTTTWTTGCTVVAAPYTCNWDTRAVADGLYDFRAVLTDGAARETVSPTVAARRVDNSPLRGTDIQTGNGTGTPGRLGTGDSMTFTYSQQVTTATVSPGWTGASLPVTVRLRDGNLLGLGNSGDTVDIQRTGSSVNLGSVNLKQNYAKSRKTVTFNATMTAATVTLGGVPRTVITVTLGTAASGANGVRTATTASTMLWAPTAAVTTLTGTASSTAPATETGPLDREY